MSDEIKRIGRELIYQGSLVGFYKDLMLLPDGKQVKWDYLHHKGAAAGVAVLEDGRLLMVRQYRDALDRYTLEIPAGGLKSEEEPTKVAAIREVEEETGYLADDANLLLSIRTTVAFCNERIDIYLMENLHKTAQNLDDDEYLNVYAFPLEELLEKIFCGELQDAKTVSAILAYKAFLERKNG